MSELNKIVTNFPMSLTPEENRNLALTLSAVVEGGGGGVANAIWRPAVDQEGIMSWSWETFPDSANPPASVSVKGPQGDSGAPGRDGTNGQDGAPGHDGADGKTPQIQINSSNAHWEWRYSGASEWTDLGVVASGAVGPQGIPGVSGASGAPGKDGQDGFSPAVTLSAITDQHHANGGTRVTITDETGDHQFDVWNGDDGSGSSDVFDPSTMSGYGTQAAPYGVDTSVIPTKTWTSGELDKKLEPPSASSQMLMNYLWRSKKNGTVDESKWIDADEWLLAHAENGDVLAPDDLEWYLNPAHGISGEWDSEGPDYKFGLWNDYEQAIQTVSARVMIPDSADVNLQNKYLVLRTKSDGTVDGWTDFQNQSYSKTEADGRYMRRETDATLDGIGTSADKLRISDTVMDEIENKSHVYMTSAGNVSVENTSGTVDANFVQYGQVGNRPIPRMLLCATADTYTEIVENVLPAASGMGAVIFVIETH